jgi:hypothetical protein
MAKKSLGRYIKKVNKWADQDNFIDYDPDLYSLSHLGDVYGFTEIKFTEKGKKCLFYNRFCDRQKVLFGSLIEFNLKVISRLRPVLKAKRLSKYMSRFMFLKGKRFKSFLKYIGYDKVSISTKIRGRYLNEKGIIKNKIGRSLSEPVIDLAF